MLSKEHDHLMNGAERSDSFSWNPHKMLGIPLQCSVFVCKHAGSLSKANSARAEYLFQPDKNNSGALLRPALLLLLALALPVIPFLVYGE